MTPGTVVMSLAGHDKGGLHMVMAADKEYAIIADGKRRKVQSPKRKKLKHLRIVEGYEIEDTAITNRQLRKAVAAIKVDIGEGALCQRKMQ